MVVKFLTKPSLDALKKNLRFTKYLDFSVFFITLVTLLPVTLPPEAKPGMLLAPCHESFSKCCTG